MADLKTIPASHIAAPNAFGGVQRHQTLFVNLFLVDSSDGGWVLVDAGLPGFTDSIVAAAARRYGAGVAPDAIILTHGHFDHVGCLDRLAHLWDVPIYCHGLELPYLIGVSDFAPQDPTVGGAGAFMSRVFPNHCYDFSDRIRALPDDGRVPGLPGWRWVHTPGHTPGHVALWRESDRTLISGDAVVTMDLDSWVGQLTHRVEISRPPTYFTGDWDQSRRSIQLLADLRPQTIFSGHGRTISGSSVAAYLKRFAWDFPFPTHGRYVESAAVTDEEGVVALPPPPPDYLPLELLGAVALGWAAWKSLRANPRTSERRLAK